MSGGLEVQRRSHSLSRQNLDIGGVSCERSRWRSRSQARQNRDVGGLEFQVWGMEIQDGSLTSLAES
ncbi:hypothetical protein RRG08_057985 [Elysia crispata]|uniref:Uncharacterized protein n=1 Tax=Elysia crispata TaxID=231223 RepID=A0AAE1AF05_9GAST|nr:hypothetical protein RRG08_057985 [Elysia crispata]